MVSLLTGITIVTGGAIIVLSCLFVKEKIRLISIAILVVTLAVSLISSYDILNKAFDPKTFQPFSLLNNPLIFGLNVLLKFLLCFWIVALGMGILYPERIAKFNANIFGVGVGNEFNKDVMVVKNNLDLAEKQNTIIVGLNRRIFDFLMKDFERGVIESADQAATIRTLIKDIILQSYLPNQVEIHVVAMDESGLAEIDMQLLSFVRPLLLENRPIIKIENKTIGIGIIPGVDAPGTVILIDTTAEKYYISDAEICAACTFYVAVVNAVNSVFDREFA